MSGWNNLAIVANLKHVDHRGIAETLELVGLYDRRRDRFKNYSLGMKQRLAIAATLLGKPELVILDEPANGLDPEGMREIRDLILSLRDRGQTVFLSSHLLHEVERTCTHVAILRKGRIVRQTSVEDLLASQTLVEVRADDLQRLQLAAEGYREAASVRLDGDAVLVDLRDGDAASLNQFLSGQGVYASHLATRRLSLEEAFMDLTREEAADPAAVA